MNQGQQAWTQGSRLRCGKKSPVQSLCLALCSGLGMHCYSLRCKASRTHLQMGSREGRSLTAGHTAGQQRAWSESLVHFSLAVESERLRPPGSPAPSPPGSGAQQLPLWHLDSVSF